MIRFPSANGTTKSVCSRISPSLHISCHIFSINLAFVVYLHLTLIVLQSILEFDVPAATKCAEQTLQLFTTLGCLLPSPRRNQLQQCPPFVSYASKWFCLLPSCTTQSNKILTKNIDTIYYYCSQLQGKLNNESKKFQIYKTFQQTFQQKKINYYNSKRVMQDDFNFLLFQVILSTDC